MEERILWRVQLWLADSLVEEYIVPAELAEQYANVIRLRIAGLPARELRCERITELQKHWYTHEIESNLCPPSSN